MSFNPDPDKPDKLQFNEMGTLLDIYIPNRTGFVKPLQVQGQGNRIWDDSVSQTYFAIETDCGKLNMRTGI
jgi:hypothetical protein